MNYQYDAYRVFDHGPYNYSVELVNTENGARFTTNSAVCGKQAHYHATKMNTRPMTFLGVFTMRNGELVETAFPTSCHVTDPSHVHVHRLALPVH